MSIEGQQALARLFGLEVDTDAPPADPAPTGLEWIGGVPFHPSDEPPPPDYDGTPDFDGGARETPPEPENPEGDHGELVKNLLGPRDGGPWLG